MDHHFSYLDYKDTGFYSRLVTDYLAGDNGLQDFYHFTPSPEGLGEAVRERCRFPVNRAVLADTLERQYAGLITSAKTAANIQSLHSVNTFTVCTAHQPNLLTGYLYFVYKILHAIKLAEALCERHPGSHFVPVYYMGSEDNDIEELGVFRFRGEKYVWDGGGQKGAVGRMSPQTLKPLLASLFKMFGPPGKYCDALQETVTTAYLKHKTIAAATQYLVNELFGRYGLVVLDADEPELKRAFVPVMEDELLRQSSVGVIAAQVARLGERYKIQAHPREINLFYLADQLRERIERKGDRWTVVNTNIEWSREQLLAELHAHPGRFSPNVVLRGLYQETILPNVAFIGGGAEVAYWLQLRTLFAHYGGFYPCILLRQSVQWIRKPEAMLRRKAGLDMRQVFLPEPQIAREYLGANAASDWQTTSEDNQMEGIIDSLKHKAFTIDPTLAPAADAALTRIRKQLGELEKKMLRAEKKKHEVHLARISRLKAALFPNGGLQERVENMMDYYLDYGPEFFDTILRGIDPLAARFLIVEEDPHLPA